MSRLTKALRTHRGIARQQRALDKAIANAASPGMREELIIVSQRNSLNQLR